MQHYVWAHNGEQTAWFRLARIFHAPEVFIGKAVKGAVVVDLLQALDNTANGHLRERPQG